MPAGAKGLIARKCSTARGEGSDPGALGGMRYPYPRRPDGGSCTNLGGEEAEFYYINKNIILMRRFSKSVFHLCLPLPAVLFYQTATSLSLL